MNAIESQEFVSDNTEQSTDNTKLVPVTESIRYRKRAQSAEKQVEDLSEQLSQAKSEAARISEQLNEIQLEQNLIRKLTAAGTVDLETAVLTVKARIESDNGADIDDVIEQLKKEKQYLFHQKDTYAPAIKKTAGVKERVQNSHTVLERAAKKAATTGSRTDLQEYLKLRRNYL
jgi:predicted  nucleic acid-binding Zn-ribbon protein